MWRISKSLSRTMENILVHEFFKWLADSSPINPQQNSFLIQKLCEAESFFAVHKTISAFCTK